MSHLHRNLLAFIADIEPALAKFAEAAVIAANPIAGAVAAPVIEELGAAAVAALAGPADAPAAPVAPAVPAPAAEPVQLLPQGSSQAQPVAPAPASVPAAEKLLASDVINALMKTLIDLQAKT